MSYKKRRREQPLVDTQLIEIYEDLANVDEKIRLKACHSLLINFVSETANGDQLNKILTRLFRGLCSGRKAARLGFSVALTEVLTELLGPRGKKVPGFQSIPDLIHTLQEQTRTSGNVSGQEERDHQFGCLFGAESIIKSGILFQSDVDEDMWAQILDMICELANKKPWLREECGFVLSNAIKVVRDKDSKYAQMIIERLKSKGLAKTPEGIAVWVVAKAECPTLQFPRHVWKHDDPLDRKEKSAVARILNEGTIAETVQDGVEAKATPKGAWSTKIHFAWDVILARLFHVSLQKEPKASKTMSFTEFWEECVDNTLFTTGSSQERKYWGFLLFQRVIHDATADIIPALFTQNLVRCLMNQLSSPERFLHRVAEKTTLSIIQRATSGPDSKIPILKALLTAPYGDVSFDRITKSKTVESLLSQSSRSDSKELIAFYEELLLRPGVQDEKVAATRRLVAADQLVSAVRNMQLKPIDSGHYHPSDTEFIGNVLRLFSRFAYFDLDTLASAHPGRPNPPFTPSTRDTFRTRISSCLAYLVAKRVDPAEISYDLICIFHDEKDESEFGTPLLEADEIVCQVIQRAWEILGKVNSVSEAKSSDSTKRHYYRSIKLLYSLTILQVYNADADAVSVLEELNVCFDGLLHKKKVETVSTTLVEILLSFASKQSQLFRRLTQQVFTACAPDVDDIGLQSMVKILEAKETLSGQAEMFDNDDDKNDDGDDEDDPSGTSDVENFDMADIDSADSASEAAVAVDIDDLSDSRYDSESPDDELAAFNARLEKAVGTRPSTQGSDAEESSSSDEDMDDEQMEAFDHHLEKVFRERKKLTSKKNEKKDAKENIINFKCRVLELFEIYLKQQHADTLALSLLLPILTVVRSTSSPLVSSKACNLMREYARLCKGEGLPDATDVESVLERLEGVHDEAGKDASNAHGNACSQASLLLVRVLVAQDRELLRRVVKVYSRTQEKTLFDSSCKVKTHFFTDWLNWCASARK